MFSSAEIAAPPFYTRDGAIFSSIRLRVGWATRKAGRLYHYFLLRALRAAIPAIIEEQARADAAIRFGVTPV